MTSEREEGIPLSLVWVNPQPPTRPASTTEAGHLEDLAEEAYQAARTARDTCTELQGKCAVAPTIPNLLDFDGALALYAKAHHEWTRLEIARLKAFATAPTKAGFTPRSGA